MSMGIQAFHDAAQGHSGIISMGNDNTVVASHRPGILGKLIAWLTGAPAEDHRAVKDQFVTALKREYGDAFVQLPAVRELLRREAADDKPLTARLVRDLTKYGDLDRNGRYAQVSLRLPALYKGLPPVALTTPYKDVGALTQAAQAFARHIDVAGKSAPLLEQWASYIKHPDPELLSSFRQQGGFAFQNFAEAFRRVDGEQNIREAATSDQLKSNCAKVVKSGDPYTIFNAAVISTSRLMGQLATQCQSLLTADSEGVAGIAVDIIQHTAAQQQTMRAAYTALGDSQIFDGLSKQDAALLRELRSNLLAQLTAMMNPDGPYQQLVALAGLAAQDPTGFRETLGMNLMDAHTVELPVADSDQPIVITSSYQSSDALLQAAEAFGSYINVQDKEAPLIHNLAVCIHHADPADLKTLRSQGGKAYQTFAQAFMHSPDSVSKNVAAMISTLSENCEKYMSELPSNSISRAAHVRTDIADDMGSWCDGLLKASTIEDTTRIAEAVLQQAAERKQTLLDGMRALSHPRIFEGVSDKNVETLSALRADFEAQIHAMNHPKGPYQQLIAFAALALQNPVGVRQALS